jgi:signal transduction histidine kinase
MTVADDGCGFAAEHSGEAPACLGLFGIRQCLAGVGGRLEIASVPGAGATVTLHVPVLAPSGAGAVVI